MVVKCKKCGSADVEIRAFVNPNTEEVSSLNNIATLITERDDCWCKDCDDYADLIIEESADSNAKLIEEIQEWWEQTDDEDREVVSGLNSSDFSYNELFQAQCETIWSEKTDEQKIEIFRTIQYRD